MSCDLCGGPLPDIPESCAQTDDGEPVCDDCVDAIAASKGVE